MTRRTMTNLATVLLDAVLNPMRAAGEAQLLRAQRETAQDITNGIVAGTDAKGKPA